MSVGSPGRPTEPGSPTEITEKYTVLRPLGRGGMGTVYEANHRVLKKRVAVKVLHEQHAGDVALMRRFMREATAVAALRSRYVVRIFDSDKTREGAPFIVMELLSGCDLGAVLRRKRPSVERVVDWIVQICSAMHEAHLRGIIHRDLKPSNVFIAEPDESVRVLDFGISRLVEGNELTAGSEVLGTPNYIAPEVLQGAPADGRSDLYAIGVIAYRALSGRFPCDGDQAAANRFSALIATVIVPATPLGELVPELPKELTDAVMKALAKDPTARFSSAREMAMALRPFGTSAAEFEELTESEEAAAPVRDPSSMPPPEPPSVDIDFDFTARLTDPVVEAQAPRSRRRSRRLIMGSVALGAVAVAVAVAVAASMARSSATRTTTTATAAASHLAAPAASASESAAPAALASESAAPAVSAAPVPELSVNSASPPSARPRAGRAPASPASASVSSTASPAAQGGSASGQKPGRPPKSSSTNEALYLE